jgi:peptide/nickel transport system permease protein
VTAAPTPVTIEASTRTASRSVLRRLLTHPLGLIPIIVLILIILATVFAPWIATQDPAFVDYKIIDAPPSAEHWLGGDSVGRDIFARLLYGGRPAFRGALIIVTVGLLVGVPGGLLAAFFGSWIDAAFSWIADVLMSVPGMIVLLIVAGGTNGDFTILMVTMGVFMSPGYYRLTRSATLAVRHEAYVEAAQVSGLSNARIIGSHILRVIAAPLIIQTSMAAGIGLSMQAGLQFLGIGDALAPSWGAMMSDGFKKMLKNSWLMVPPAIALGLTIASLALLGSTLGEITGNRSDKTVRMSAQGRRAKAAAARAKAAAARPPADDVAVEIRNLRVAYLHPKGETEVVHGVDFTVRQGEVLGIVGESGSGKTQSMFSFLDLLPGNGYAEADALWLNGQNLLAMSRAERRGLLGTQIGYIPQEPVPNLDPTFTIGHQLTEPMRKVLKMSKAAAHDHAIALLTRVGIADPERMMRLHPHEISGGMAQRVLIAGAIAGHPSVLVADEPTTALDVTVQAEVLELLRELQEADGMSLILVTHNFGVVADICDRVVVMQDGLVVERGEVRDLFQHPGEAYTAELIAASLDGTETRAELDAVVPASVPANVPELEGALS